MTNEGIDVPAGLPALHAALRDVARGLAPRHGRRQFYTLAQVQAQLQAGSIDPALAAWVYAAFVTCEDFDAYFAVRDVAGSYGDLRAAMSAPAPPIGVPEKSFELPDDGFPELLNWLDALGEF